MTSTSRLGPGSWLKVLDIRPTGGTFTLGADREVIIVVPPMAKQARRLTGRAASRYYVSDSPGGFYHLCRRPLWEPARAAHETA